MNETLATSKTTNPPLVNREPDVIDLLITLAKHKRSIIITPLVAATVAGAISFALPNTYKATVKLLPPQQSQSGAAALLSQLGGVAGSLAGAAGIKGTNDLYIGILKSRTIADNLVNRFGLKSIYKVDTVEGARKKLEGKTSISSSKDGLIVIDVEDAEKKRTATLANAYVDELLKITKTLAVTEAAQRRMFYEQQLEISKNNLAATEIKLKENLDSQGIASVDADSQSIVQTIGRLRAQISAKEIEVRSMQMFVTTQNPDYQKAQEELNSLKVELLKLQDGEPVGAAVAEQKKSGKGLENVKLLRDMKYHQMLYQLLAKQYEAARLDEAKDTAIVQVLDPAIEPETKIGPPRMLLILASALLGFVAAVICAVVREGLSNALRVPERAARWMRLRSYF
jgi:uncharacterized protein involved in exopolysaccharide biosynthesis